MGKRGDDVQLELAGFADGLEWAWVSLMEREELRVTCVFLSNGLV